MPHTLSSTIRADLDLTREEIKCDLKEAGLEATPGQIEHLVRRLCTTARDAAKTDLVDYIEHLRRLDAERKTTHALELGSDSRTKQRKKRADKNGDHDSY
jgi:hypothetical protein